MEKNKIYNMDCLEGIKAIPSSSIDCFITDPPYRIISGGITNLKRKDEVRGIFNKRNGSFASNYARQGKLFKYNEITFKEWLPEVFRVMKNRSHIYIFTNDRNMNELITEAEKAGFQLVNILIWKKNNATPNRYYLKNAEFIVLFRKGQARTINNRGTKTVIEMNIVKNRIHPTEKPVELLKMFIENSTEKNDVVLDCFLGSSSLAVACMETDRNFIGFEIDKEYYEKSIERIGKYAK